ncbi:hypothetical protein GQ43DRAFT_450707 [Delitschia confertaspora ATCC 74209]|uniref:Uncharacterized protein n=1 Tax=Delitschia confertaspora ATCC 74209 TaxID=1513339 RepID=A0A9P4MMZ3_9PLEO|nr:hypothetical protein GQ43DRAFT_450707 [Delitschia confertaspora ATCC 74209]
MATAVPNSSHISDATLRPFLQPTFDPADYLNATLPSLSTSSRSSKNAVPLADLSSQTQDLLSQLNAHTTRLSTVLTQLTEDILRSGARLAYEVEVLRGETISLTDALTVGLKPDIEKFLPGGVPVEAANPNSEVRETEDGPEKGADNQDPTSSTDGNTTEPPYVSQLRTLTLVRLRLEAVIKVFGEAMHWTLPPSEVSLASSLISVSAPEPGSDNHSREEKGRQFAENLRMEISDLISGSEDGQKGKEAAMIRIQALRDLAKVWKGTAEERARMKFIDGLVKLAEERQKALDSGNQKQRPGRSGSAAKPPVQQKSGGRFLDNLSRIRGNIYLE